MGGAVCSFLVGSAASLVVTVEEGYVKEVITHAKEGVAHEKETHDEG